MGTIKEGKVRAAVKEVEGGCIRLKVLYNRTLQQGSTALADLRYSTVGL